MRCDHHHLFAIGLSSTSSSSFNVISLCAKLYEPNRGTHAAQDIENISSSVWAYILAPEIGCKYQLQKLGLNFSSRYGEYKIAHFGWKQHYNMDVIKVENNHWQPSSWVMLRLWWDFSALNLVSFWHLSWDGEAGDPRLHHGGVRLPHRHLLPPPPPPPLVWQDQRNHHHPPAGGQEVYYCHFVTVLFSKLSSNWLLSLLFLTAGKTSVGFNFYRFKSWLCLTVDFSVSSFLVFLLSILLLSMESQ